MDAGEAVQWLAAWLAEELTDEELARVRSAMDDMSRNAPGRKYSVKDVIDVAVIVIRLGGPVTAADFGA